MDINQTFERIFALYNSKGDPNAMIQNLYKQNPNINQFSTQFGNMIKGKSRPEAYMQIAKQLGMNEQNLKTLGQMLNIKQ